MQMNTELKIGIYLIVIALALTYAINVNATEGRYWNEADKQTRRDESGTPLIYWSPYWSYKSPAKNLYVISIKSQIDTADKYEDMKKYLSKLTKKDTLVIEVSSLGGSNNGLGEILEHVKAAKVKKLVGHVAGPSYSAAAYLMCNMDTVLYEKGTFLMFHAARVIVTSPGALTMTKLSTLLLQVHAETEYLLEPCLKKKILTQDEANVILTDVEVYKYPDGSSFINYDSRGI